MSRSKHSSAKPKRAASTKPKTALLLLQCDATHFEDNPGGTTLASRLIGHQRHIGLRIAANLQVTIRQEYIELGSGTTVPDFTAVMEMLSDAELLQGRIDYVITPDVSYVFESLAEVQAYFDAIYDAGAIAIPFRVDLHRSDDPEARALLGDLYAFYAKNPRLALSHLANRWLSRGIGGSGDSGVSGGVGG